MVMDERRLVSRRLLLGQTDHPLFPSGDLHSRTHSRTQQSTEREREREMKTERRTVEEQRVNDLFGYLL
jgi:hypothetical protein